MPIDTSILGSYQPPKQENLFNTLAQFEAIRSAQQQGQMNAMQIQKAQRELQEEEIMNALLANPQVLDPLTGQVQPSAFAEIGRQGAGRLAPKFFKLSFEQQKAQREAAAAQADLEAKQTKLLSDKLAQYGDALRYVETPEAALAWGAQLHTDPATSKYFKSIGVTPEQTRQEIEEAQQAGDLTGWKAKQMQAKEELVRRFTDQSDIKAAWTEANKIAKPTTDVPLTENGEGRQVSTDTESLYRAFIDSLHIRGRNDLAKQWLAQYEQTAMLPYAGLPPAAAELEAMRRHPELRAMKERLTELSSPKTYIDLGAKAQAKYGEALAGKVADKDTKLMEAAEKAPELVQTSDRILSLVRDPNLITGFGADFRLQMARALNLLGADNTETLRNTEVLLSSLGSQTLNAIQESGLGTGQGFTDNDRTFLQEAKAGRLEFNRETLARLAKLSRKAAEATAQRWNARRAKMPAEVRDSLGVTEDVVIKPLKSRAESQAEPLSGPTRQSADPTVVTLPDGRQVRFPNKKTADEFRRKYPQE